MMPNKSSIMKIIEIITEAKSAPLYHFTTIDKLLKIIDSNTFIAQKPRWERDTSKKISPIIKLDMPVFSVTRDYDRQFVPGNFMADEITVGIQLDQVKLARLKGRKQKPVAAKPGFDEKDYLDMLKGPQGEKLKQEYFEIKDRINKGEDVPKHGSMRYNGVDPYEVAHGASIRKSRWESEERIEGDIPNAKDYITGIILPGSGRKNIDIKDLVQYIQDEQNKRHPTFARSKMLSAALKLHVPIIRYRKEFNPEQVKRAMDKDL